MTALLLSKTRQRVLERFFLDDGEQVKSRHKGLEENAVPVELAPLFEVMGEDHQRKTLSDGVIRQRWEDI